MGVRAGWPDLEIVHQGRVIFIEIKAPKRGSSAKNAALERAEDDRLLGDKRTWRGGGWNFRS